MIFKGGMNRIHLRNFFRTEKNKSFRNELFSANEWPRAARGLSRTEKSRLGRSST
jgi:hypothetical protein